MKFYAAWLRLNDVVIAPEQVPAENPSDGEAKGLRVYCYKPGIRSTFELQKLRAIAWGTALDAQVKQVRFRQNCFELGRSCRPRPLVGTGREYRTGRRGRSDRAMSAGFRYAAAVLRVGSKGGFVSPIKKLVPGVADCLGGVGVTGVK